MKSIELNFKKVVEENPNLSTYVCFAKSVSSKKLSKDMIKRWFNKLVDKEDYKGVNKEYLFSQLEELTNRE